MENPAVQADGDLDPSLKLAIAMAVIQSRRRQRIPPPSAYPTSARDGDSQAKSGHNSESDAIKWKIKVRILVCLSFCVLSMHCDLLFVD